MLTCGFCGNKIRQPKYLPCHHSFCFRCIFNAKQSQQKIVCKTCDTNHVLSFEQMNTLMDDTMKSNLILPFMNEKLKHQKTTCDVCDDFEEPGISACVDCEIFLCELHQKAHYKAKETKSHQLILHSPNPFVVANKHHSQSTVGSMKTQHGPSTPTHNTQALIFVPSPTEFTSTTPPHKRRLDDTSDDERVSRKKGRRSGANDLKWDQNFELMKTMRAQHGNFNFLKDNPALHGWVQYMKAAYKRGKLAPERVDALEQIGFMECRKRTSKMGTKVGTTEGVQRVTRTL